jgi:hypothetical protein
VLCAVISRHVGCWYGFSGSGWWFNGGELIDHHSTPPSFSPSFNSTRSIFRRLLLSLPENAEYHVRPGFLTVGNHGHGCSRKASLNASNITSIPLTIEAALGPNHPHTLASMANLASGQNTQEVDRISQRGVGSSKGGNGRALSDCRGYNLSTQARTNTCRILPMDHSLSGAFRRWKVWGCAIQVNSTPDQQVVNLPD